MPETKTHARARAKRLHIPLSHVVKGKAGYFIAPRGVNKKSAQRSYAGMRSAGYSKAKAAKIAHSIQARSK